MNIGLVLSGGMGKGAYQIGALRALNEFIPLKEIKYISCASVGVLNGYAYATDNLDVAEDIWKNACNESSRLFVNQVLRSSMLQQNIVRLYDEEKKLSSKFYAALLDISHRNLIYKDLSTVEGAQIPLYLKASVAMPIYNKSVQIDETSYFDGAMVDNIPVHPLMKYNLDYIICVYFDDTCYKFESAYFDNKVVKVTFPSKTMVKQSVLVNKDSIEEMIKDGYERTKYILKNVFAEGFENLDYIYDAIEQMNRDTNNNSLRITGDVLVTNLNKITQKLTRKKII